MATTTFEYADLNTIDPELKPIPKGVYDLQLRNIAKRSFTYKKDIPKRDIKEGDPGEFISVTFIVTNDDEHSGRRLTPTLWPGDGALRVLRRIMDATGIVQESGQALEDWYEVLTQEAPFVRCFVNEGPDNNGDMVNRVVWRELQPASATE